MNELARPIRVDTIGTAAQRVAIVADMAERERLAIRFGLVRLDRLEGQAVLVRVGDRIRAAGTLSASLVQACVASGEDVPATIEEPFELAFVEPDAAMPADELELDAGALDLLTIESGAIDLGEALAQTLALALDPYPRAPGAEAALRAAGVQREGEGASGPFAALAGMLRKG